jgi:hypothetical protein
MAVDTVDVPTEHDLARQLADLPAEARERIDSRVKMYAPIDEVDPPPGFDFVPDLGAIASGGIPEPERLIPGLLYTNRVHWLSGHPGHGKTTIAAHAARQHMEQGGHVVWLDFEAGLRPTVARMLAVGAEPATLAERFHLAVSPALTADDDGFAKIAAALEQYPGALIVFDSASKALSAAGFDENNPTEATVWTTKIIIPAREAGATVVVIDHVVKGATKSTPYARGAGSKLADTDAAWYVEATVRFDRETPSKIELTRHKDREGLLPERLSFEVGDGAGMLPVKQVDAETEDTKAARGAGMRGKVLAALQEHSTPEQPLTGNQVVRFANGRKEAVLAALGELCEMDGSGVYMKPGPNRSVLYWYDPTKRRDFEAMA